MQQCDTPFAAAVAAATSPAAAAAAAAAGCRSYISIEEESLQVVSFEIAKNRQEKQQYAV